MPKRAEKSSIADRTISKNPLFAERVARRFYIDGLKKGEIADEEKVSAATVTRSLEFAQEQKIVTISINAVGGFTPNTELAEELRKKLQLNCAIVLDPSDSNNDPAYEANKDDNLHYALCSEMAKYLKNQLRQNDHIATVGGRGTFFVARQLAMEKTRSRNISVSAISGRMGTFMHDPNVAFAEASLDASDSAFFLAKALCGEKFDQFYPLNRDVSEDNYQSSEAKQTDFGHLYSEENEITADILLCGVGRLGGNHMFIRHQRDSTAGRDPRLKELEDDIQKLVAQTSSEKIGDEDFYPIADVANRLFTTDPAINGSITKQLETINKNIVGLTFSELAQIENVYVNAGGDHKYPAIRTLLRFKRPGTDRRFVDVLCTDSRVAKRLLNDDVEIDIAMEDLPGESG